MDKYTGQIVDITGNSIFPGSIEVKDGKISEINEIDRAEDNYIIPGFIDSHIHIESSMLPPSEFGRIAVQHGTIAVVCDPHEIANVMGIEGIEFMIENASKSPVKFYFSAPSCVPATDLETSGAKIDAGDIEKLFQKYPEEIKFLGEMMNFPGVINQDPEVMQKIEIAREYNKPIDGHAPGIVGEELKKYAAANISTDHECSTREEALEKLKQGMKILIREGSAAKNFEELIPLAEDHFENMAFCSDDKHPDDLIKRHINLLVQRAIKSKIDPFKVLKMASFNSVQHYDLDVGLLREGDPADFLIVDNLENMKIKKTAINGSIVYEGDSIPESQKVSIINNFNVSSKKPDDFVVPKKSGPINVIKAQDGDLFTQKLDREPKIKNNQIVSDVDRDILKIANISRYKDQDPAVSFVNNYGLEKGAIASSVSHDSHNILAVGVSDTDICKAVNLIVEHKGGLSVVCKEEDLEEIMELPIAGLMSDKDYNTVARQYKQIDQWAKNLGSNMSAPFMTLSFMALLVIPEIKLSEQGLFNVNKFEFIDN